MNTIKAFFLASLISVLFSVALSGCYTELACVNDEQESAVEPSQIVLYQPEIVSVFVPMPVFIQQPSPVYNVLPVAGSTSTAAPAQSRVSTENHRISTAGSHSNPATGKSCFGLSYQWFNTE